VNARCKFPIDANWIRDLVADHWFRREEPLPLIQQGAGTGAIQAVRVNVWRYQRDWQRSSWEHRGRCAAALWGWWSSWGHRGRTTAVARLPMAGLAPSPCENQILPWFHCFLGGRCRPEPPAAGEVESWAREIEVGAVRWGREGDEGDEAQMAHGIN
jgi:hypothetical protein